MSHPSEEELPLLAQAVEQGHGDSVDIEGNTVEDKRREEIERSLLRKLDLRMSFLVFLFILNYIDRTNAAAARLRGFEEDLRMEGTQFSSVISVFYVSYIFTQIPSNMLLSKISKPSLYLAASLLAPGAITFCTGLVTTYRQALFARFLLGLSEAPFYPGVMFILGRWYKRKELSQRMAYLVCGQLISVAFGNLIASFILKVMEGVFGLPAWHWLFFIEGGMTIAAAVAAAFILPDYPETQTSWLTPEEHMLAIRRMAEDSVDASKLPVDVMLSLSLTISDWKVWCIAAGMFLATVSTSFMIFFPTLTATMGYNATISLLLCAPPYLMAAASSVWLSRHSDQTQERCMHTIAPYAIAICGLLLAMVTMNTAIRYLSLFLMAQASIGDVVFYAWASSTVGDPPEKRAVALALMNAIGQAGNIAGSYVWVSEWGPTYRKSFMICTAALVASISVCLWLREALKRLNKEMDLEDERGGLHQPFVKSWRYLI